MGESRVEDQLETLIGDEQVLGNPKSRVEEILQAAIDGEDFEFTPKSRVESLLHEYINGGGGGGRINRIEFEGVRAVQVDFDPTWLDTYDYILIVPEIQMSASDYMYFAVDSKAGSTYTEKMQNYGSGVFCMITKTGSNNLAIIFTGNTSQGYLRTAQISSYLYAYTYNANNSMSGKFDIYGVRV